MRRNQLYLKIVLIPIDFVVCFFSFLFAYRFRSLNSEFINYYFFSGYIPDISSYLKFLIFISLSLIVIFFLSGLYSFKENRRTIDLVPKITTVFIVWVFFISSYFFWTRTFFFSRFVLILGFVLLYFFTILLRIVSDWIKDYGITKNKFQKLVVLIGSGNLDTIIASIEENGEYRVMKILNSIGLEIPILDSFIKESKIFEIIQTDVGKNVNLDQEILDYCQVENIKYNFIPDICSFHNNIVESRQYPKFQLITFKQTPLDGWGQVFKRCFDILFSLTFLVFFSPLYLLIAFLVKVSSKGRVFVGLERIRYRDVFKIYKFRSMVEGAHQMKGHLIDKNERKDGPLFKMKNDPRITKIGSFLRKTRLDEIPQFWNVLKGDMSIVGPRPHEPEEVKKYQKHHKKLLAIKPGVTGMAQVNGASDLLFEDEVRLDTYYIEHWSLWLDIQIIIKTVFVVIFGKGAS